MYVCKHTQISMHKLHSVRCCMGSLTRNYLPFEPPGFPGGPFSGGGGSPLKLATPPPQKKRDDQKHPTAILNIIGTGSCLTATCITVDVQWRLVSDRFTKRNIPEYGQSFDCPKFFPIHIMYYQIQKADRPAIRDTNHPFSVPNYKRSQKKIIQTFTV